MHRTTPVSIAKAQCKIEILLHNKRKSVIITVGGLNLKLSENHTGSFINVTMGRILGEYDLYFMYLYENRTMKCIEIASCRGKRACGSMVEE
jgi:hypothetical protein